MDWARAAADRGAGEILLTSIDLKNGKVVQLIQGERLAIDDAADRCSAAVYPYPDQDVAVQPNHDGPVMVLRSGINFDANTPDIDIAPTGRITTLTGGLPLAIVVSDTHETRSITITAAGQVRSS